jgi:hypothetical protein
MTRKPTANQIAIASLFIVLSVVLFIHFRGEPAEAAAPVIPMNVTQQAIHDYGRGHQSAPGPSPAFLPDETDTQFQAHIANLLAQENFGELEQIAQQLRIDKSRVKGGTWKLSLFYDGVGELPDTNSNSESDWQTHLATVKKWVAASPQSATARISLASAYLNYAYAARGSGYSNSVSDSGWQRFYKRTAWAKSTLLEAAQLQEKCPYWYEAMQQVAVDEGWDKQDARALVDQAAAFEPTYYHYYRMYANYLLPKWYGEEGETQAFAEETAAKLPEPDASITYYEIASLIACQCDSERDSLTGMSWPRVRDGYENLVRLYGASELKSNRFAYMSFVAGDKSSAKEAFASIQQGRNHRVWRSEANFSSAQAWANQP